ncbi:Bifunctional protein FolD protein [Candidatus Trichorickettsia mobilis]|uniref:Bifunctional protein FolD n=1 Tax=Candidatus Trichorickettsia mobilis TaxID=1346319 RepID=A0ABZ0UTN8_9RICK|nr:bifunctional 5,10-methylenetetrahydrofolate dehydrogenase/5,10-methenyltetrahydrofolate cyclohydrolase [Candidatus Trichorickettsia mobilis]WPY01413.1 Bifunctional protein FolD protein [Candidatus Trichorickettsia mobilis]
MKQYPSNIIDGKQYAALMLKELTEKVKLLKLSFNIVPTIAVILVGDNPASIIYVRGKLKAAADCGMNAATVNLPSTVTNAELLNCITALNDDDTISGIIVQLPLPTHIDQKNIALAISPDKDIDGFHPLNVGCLYNSAIFDGFIPPTALGCLALIKKCDVVLAEAHAVIIGRSNIVGRPLAALLLKEDCTVTICHSKTKNLQNITSQADIVISAIGIPAKLSAKYFNPNAIVIDVGITRLSADNSKIVGDVDFFNVYDKVRFITPVPGGVGPMTIAFLLSNTLKACCRQHHLTDLYV